MSLHLRIKLGIVGPVIVFLITAFNALSAPVVDISISPEVTLLPASEARFSRYPLAAELPEQGPSQASYTLRATGYNSVPEQTNSEPFITATGARTRFGIIAVSRDLLPSHIPYGSLVRLRDLGTYHGGRNPGRYQAMLDRQGLFIVEDTLHMRKRNQIDVWFETIPQAVNWGVRRVEVEVVRYGRDGPYLAPVVETPPIDVHFTASR